MEEFGVRGQLSAQLVCDDQDLRQPRPSNRVVLVETRALLRETLAYLLEKSLAGIIVEARMGIEDIQPGPACLVLLGPSLGEILSSALPRLLSTVQRTCHQTPIGAILRRSSDGKLRDLQALGLAGAVVDDAGVEIVIAAVRLMIAGVSCFPREASGPIGLAEPEVPVLAAGLAEPEVPVLAAPEAQSANRSGLARGARPESALTLRESQILSLLREGHRNKVIALELGISEATVKVHVQNIFKKLNVSNRTQVALSVIRKG